MGLQQEQEEQQHQQAARQRGRRERGRRRTQQEHRQKRTRTMTTMTATVTMSAATLLLLLLFLTAAPPAVVARRKSGASRSLSRPIQVINNSKSKVELFWVHPDTGETVLMSNPSIFPGADHPLDSFVGHEFLVRELATTKAASGVPSNPACTKSDKSGCRESTFVVSENDDQLIHVNDDIEAVFVDNKIKAREQAADIVQDCKDDAQSRIEKAAKRGDQKASLKAMEDLVRCVEKGVAARLEVVNEEIAFQSSVRTDIAGLLENYTCADDSLNSTEDMSTHVWSGSRDRKRRTVHVKHDRPTSKIHVIEDFINTDECDAMENAAKPTLHHATVADGKGGSRLSENRKAMQAGIKVPWTKEKDDDPIARISRRVYDYTNDVLKGLNIEEHGQEDLMSIQYFGRGTNDTAPDRYTPHCDGDCTGLPHKYGTRMATMVMYCTVADRGGHTNFRNAGVHVKPEAGNGIFFSYIDPETKLMDTGFTEHSGCPVFEGEKKIVTQWIRYGVDNDNPWDSFNTLGIKKSDVMAYEGDEEEEGEAAEAPADDDEEEYDYDEEYEYDEEEEEEEDDSMTGDEL